MAEAIREATAAISKKSMRLISIDAFRAVTVAAMIFMDHPTGRNYLPWFLLHPEWHGLTLADLVFPAFLFISGTSMAFSARKPVPPEMRARANMTFLKRVGMLFAIGYGLNLVKYGLPLRYGGVLQRIGLASLIAYPFRRKDPLYIVAFACILIATHTVVMLFVGAPGVAAGGFGPGPTISGWIDTNVFGLAHTYGGSGYDPEGILGTLTAAAHMLFGLALGRVLVEYPRDKGRLRNAAMLAVGAILAGAVLSIWVPINKKLWTGSFTLITAGGAVLTLLALYLITDYRGNTKAVDWLVPLGRNALLVYVGSNVLLAVALHVPIVTPSGNETVLFSAARGLVGRTSHPVLISLFISGAEVAMWYAVSVVLHRKKIYLKL